MSKIRQLSETLVSQIKAGEVIERPASALKEMLENAIDSGATSIKASIEKGGLSLICVEDDGEGIAAEDLPLAFARHATSKIATFEDLLSATTMGFRGEALASLGSVAKCKISSKRAGAEAFEVECEEGRIGPVSPSSRRDGTTASARDLFFYVPARRKFLKSEPTESAHCRDAFARAALSRPDIAMSFHKDGKQLHRLPAQSALERAKALLGSSFAGPVATVSASFGSYKIEGFAAPLGALPSGKETQLLYVNRRFARDRLLSHAAKEALIQSRGLGREREVAYVLSFTLPTELVDANAHPAKTEVRFKDPRSAHQFVYKALADALRTLPPPEALPSERGRPLESALREPEADLFGTAAPAAGGRAELSNDAERFLGKLRSGLCAWDDGKGLWLAAPRALAQAKAAQALAAKAEEGALAGEQQLIPARASGLADCAPILANRRGQLLSLGIELAWEGSSGACSVAFAPEGFDNCDWGASLRAMAARLGSGRADAVSLCVALASGLPTAEPSDEEIWRSASLWMGMRRLARELPGAFHVDFPSDAR